MSYDGETYTSHPILDKDNLIRECQVFKKSIETRNSITNGKKKDYRTATYVGGQGTH